MKKVLVTGAAGFMGSHIVEKYLSMRFEVVSTDDLSGGFIENVSKKSKFILGDLKRSCICDFIIQGRTF